MWTTTQTFAEFIASRTHEQWDAFGLSMLVCAALFAAATWVSPRRLP